MQKLISLLIATLFYGGVVLADSISTSTINSHTVITFNGNQVWEGDTKGPVRAKSVSDNGVTFAAAFEGERVLWENSPGAAEHLKQTRIASPNQAGYSPVMYCCR
jgi:hypothetical protein